MSTTVIKISGSVFDWNVIGGSLPPLLDLFKRLHNEGHKLILVAGGGETARKYIELGRKIGIDEATLDDIGLKAARLNAELLVGGLRDFAFPSVPETLDGVAEAVTGGKIVAVGGFHPGHSTNAVAALIAEKVHANLFVNATDVDGVYTSDPKKDVGAKKLESVSVSELKRMLEHEEMRAGTYELLDLVALKIVERSDIKTVVVKCDPNSVQRAVLGRPVGTTITVN